jgi:hypothetical protein
MSFFAALGACFLFSAAAYQPVKFSAGSFYAGLRRSTSDANTNVMVDLNAPDPLTLRWGLECVGPCNQTSYSLRIWEERGGGGKVVSVPVVDTGVVSSSQQQHTLQNSTVFRPATRYTWEIKTNVSSALAVVSSKQRFFTALSTWQAKPIWARKNASGTLPMYAFLRSNISVPAGQSVVSALAFVTANPPETIMGNPAKASKAKPLKHLPPKVLAGELRCKN